MDDSLPFSPRNYQWITKSELSRRNYKKYGNGRDVIKLTYNGKTQSIPQWAKEIGIATTTLRIRLKTHSVEESLSTPPDGFDKRRPTRTKGNVDCPWCGSESYKRGTYRGNQVYACKNDQCGERWHKDSKSLKKLIQSRQSKSN